MLNSIKQHKKQAAGKTYQVQAMLRGMQSRVVLSEAGVRLINKQFVGGDLENSQT